MTLPPELIDNLRKLGELARRYDDRRRLLENLEAVKTGEAIREQYMSLIYHQCGDTRVLGPTVNLSVAAANKMHRILIADVKRQMAEIEEQLS